MVDYSYTIWVELLYDHSDNWLTCFICARVPTFFSTKLTYDYGIKFPFSPQN